MGGSDGWSDKAPVSGDAGGRERKRSVPIVPGDELDCIMSLSGEEEGKRTVSSLKTGNDGDSETDG